MSPKRKEEIKRAFEIIRKELPCAMIRIVDDPGIPGVNGSHQYIEVDP